MARKSEPLYLQLTDALIAQVKDGVYADGSLLPSERELCESYNVSRTTVRQALHELAAKGYTKSIHGKGTVLVHSQLRQELNSFSSISVRKRPLIACLSQEQLARLASVQRSILTLLR